MSTMQTCMCYLYAAIIVILANLNNEVSSQCVRNDTVARPYNKLLRDLFCEYNSDAIPARSLLMKITINFFPTYFLMDEEYRTIHIFGLVKMTWNDMSLTWSPLKYNNIASIQGTNFDIWEPDLVSHEGGMTGYFVEVDTFVDKNVNITYNGQIKFNSKMILNGHCITHLYDWPFDQLDCTVIAGVSKQSTLNIRLDYDDQELNLSRFSREDRNWKLLNISRSPWISKTCTTKSRCPVAYTITLKRKSRIHESTIIFPQICITILCLCTFGIFKGTVYRLTLFITILLSQIMYLIYLVYHLGLNEEQETVRLFNFFTGMSWIATAGIIQTLANKYMLSRQNQSLPPDFIMTFVEKVYDNKYTQNLYNVYMKNNNEVIIDNQPTIDDDNTHLNEKPAGYEYWRRFSDLCNIFMFILTMLYTLVHFAIILYNAW